MWNSVSTTDTLAPPWASSLLGAQTLRTVEDLLARPEARSTGVGAVEVARALGVGPALANEELLNAEQQGAVQPRGSLLSVHYCYGAGPVSSSQKLV